MSCTLYILHITLHMLRFMNIISRTTPPPRLCLDVAATSEYVLKLQHKCAFNTCMPFCISPTLGSSVCPCHSVVFILLRSFPFRRCNQHSRKCIFYQLFANICSKTLTTNKTQAEFQYATKNANKCSVQVRENHLQE